MRKSPSKMKPRGKFFQDDAGPYTGFIMHVSSTKATVFNHLRIGNQSQKKALIGSEIGADTCCEMAAGSF
ncbi:hypothetical protein L6164_013712 [Bauhinia variegata]|uniref:Uncharacterized protein n=1 Tax=Bauhinia variegata TaxID=167791 RepID=A0ACB9NIN3_BAUVA|nr:hypothetical protein L6164_013712 [Bauhinia variegata]